jgi:hypothetical protein
MGRSEEYGETSADSERQESMTPVNPRTAQPRAHGRFSGGARSPERDSVTGGQNQHGASQRGSSIASTARAQALVRIGTRRRMGAIHGAAQRVAANMHMGQNLPAYNMGDTPSPR